MPRNSGHLLQLADGHDSTCQKKRRTATFTFVRSAQQACTDSLAPSAKASASTVVCLLLSEIVAVRHWAFKKKRTTLTILIDSARLCKSFSSAKSVKFAKSLYLQYCARSHRKKIAQSKKKGALEDSSIAARSSSVPFVEHSSSIDCLCRVITPWQSIPSYNRNSEKQIAVAKIVQ
jgi:hypothetical protein